MSYVKGCVYRIKGFTLIEILIVIGIIAILAGIVLVAINPARQFRQAGNTQRESNVNAILNAIGQYTVDHKGDNSALGFSSTTVEQIESGGANICNFLVPTYIPALPSDPDSVSKGVGITNCSNYQTGYNVIMDGSGRVKISAPLAIDPDTGVASTTLISVTR